MSASANLTCPRAACHGEYRYLGDSDAGTLFECDECGDRLEQSSALEELAAGDGPAAELVGILLDGVAVE